MWWWWRGRQVFVEILYIQLVFHPNPRCAHAAPQSAGDSDISIETLLPQFKRVWSGPLALFNNLHHAFLHGLVGKGSVGKNCTEMQIYNSIWFS